MTILTPSRFTVGPAPGASKSPSRDTMSKTLPALNPAKRRFIPSRYLDRWENEGGAWLDKQFIAFNS